MPPKKSNTTAPRHKTRSNKFKQNADGTMTGVFDSQVAQEPSGSPSPSKQKKKKKTVRIVELPQIDATHQPSLEATSSPPPLALHSPSSELPPQPIKDTENNIFLSPTSAASTFIPSPSAPTYFTSVLDLSQNLEPSRDESGVEVQLATPKGSAKKKKKTRKARDIWEFIRVAEQTGQRFCKFCDADGEKKAFSSQTGTGSIRKHLFTFHFEDWVHACDEQEIAITAQDAELQRLLQDFWKEAGKGKSAPIFDGGKDSHLCLKYSHDAFVDAIVEWIVSDDQSLNMIENVKLRNIFLMLKKDLRNSDIPHRNHIRDHAICIWEDYLDKLKGDIKKGQVGKSSFTSDLWTDPIGYPFMAITMHWIEAIAIKTDANGTPLLYELKMQADLVGFFRVPQRHTGRHLASVFNHVLNRIEVKKYGWVTLDNASNNNTMMRHLASLLASRGITDFSKDENRISFEMRLIRASSIQRDTFAEIQDQLDLPRRELLRDVCTRWSSTQLMIKRALENQKAIDEFFNQEPDLHKYALTDYDWHILQDYQTILAVPHAFQEKLSGEKTPTLGNVIPTFQIFIKKWELYKESMPNYSEVIEAGLSKLIDYYDKMIGIDAYTLAILVIHPGRKLHWFNTHAPDDASDARDTFICHLQRYHVEAGIQTPARPTHLAQENWADLLLDDLPPSSATSGARAGGLADKVEAYFLDNQYNSDPVRFWQDNQHRFPTIFCLALDILPIQASAVPCKRVFSSAKETMTPRRNRIKSDLMEALQMLKFSLRYGRTSLSFTEGLSKQTELASLEDRGTYDTKCPEDFSLFNSHLRSKSGASTTGRPSRLGPTRGAQVDESNDGDEPDTDN
ncbi:hypothetical protein NP233_g6642 [Leucocoprinus birnbaumii]|uniref:HAT C-terminal dimerisation domain-containing protein n=1 Tax=Leucocoprinus birnbaumii TaxID=56174 RepID=A0AAD5VU72_9AGAR|nr:hypothetical protein NP233_g6642 [Leucocoprinus birnbaumii]